MITKDTYHKVKDQYKNETLFARDQKEHPEKFDEIANEVWYAGAALVNEDGEVEKNLEVTYAGEGQGRNRKLDKDGNTIYEINGAGDLRGKIIEVIALDGSSNFTKIHRIKFADHADEKGNSYMGLFSKSISQLETFKWQDQVASSLSLLVWLLLFTALTILQSKRLRKYLNSKP